jgi:hypothetical protein
VAINSVLRFPPVTFQKSTPEEIVAGLRRSLSNAATVSFTPTPTPVITIREGMWRCSQLILDNTSNEIKLVGIHFSIRGFLPHALIMATGALAFSLSIIIVAFVVTGEFDPVLALGGVAGVAAANIVETIFLLVIKKTWSPKLLNAVKEVGV